MKKTGKLAAAIGAGILLACAAAAFADESAPKSVLDDGREVYAENCAYCHGDKAKGDGPMASILTVKPADLTQIAKKNNGNFDFWKAFGTIDGRTMLRAHGSAEMPIWGSKFKSTWAQGWGLAGMRARMIQVTMYIQSIQEK